MHCPYKGPLLAALVSALNSLPTACVALQPVNRRTRLPLEAIPLSGEMSAQADKGVAVSGEEDVAAGDRGIPKEESLRLRLTPNPPPFDKGGKKTILYNKGVYR